MHIIKYNLNCGDNKYVTHEDPVQVHLLGNDPIPLGQTSKTVIRLPLKCNK